MPSWVDRTVMRERGHMALAPVFWICLILGAIAAEQLYKYKTGGSLAAMVNWWWVAAAGGGIALLLVVVGAASHKRVRIEQAGDKTIVHFGKQQFERLPDPPEVSRWTTGGAFGQPTREWIALKRAGEVIYEGPAEEGERLLAALSQQPLAGGDAAKV